MVRTVALLATMIFAASAAHADDGGPPGLTIERAASEPLPRWEVHLGGGVGAARAMMFGSEHGAVAISIDTEVIRWSNPNTGFGLYVGEIIAQPWNEIKMDDHAVHRDLPFIIEPEVVHRSVRQYSRHVAVGWTASLAAGAVVTRTEEMWSPLFSQHVYEKTLEHGVAAGTTAQASVFLHAGPVAVAVGPRVSADSAGDLAVNLEATTGLTW